MARIYRYPAYVINVSAVDSSTPIPRRSKLAIEFDRPNGGQALFIMMNPSKATSDVSDKTVNGIIKYTYEKCYLLNAISRIVVLNLYTVYETDSGQLAQIVEQYGHAFASGNDGQRNTTNDEILASEAGRSEVVVAAWGKPSAATGILRKCGYFRRVYEVLEILQN